MIYVRKSMAVYMLFPLNWFQVKANTILLKSLHVLFKFLMKNYGFVEGWKLYLVTEGFDVSIDIILS